MHRQAARLHNPFMRRLAPSLGCLLVLAVSALGIWYVLSSLMAPTVVTTTTLGTDPERRAYLTQHGIHLPRPADDLQVHYEGLRDWSVWTTFTTDERGVRYFLGGQTPDATPDEEALSWVLRSRFGPPWWQPPDPLEGAFTTRGGLCAGVTSSGRIWFGCVKR